MMIILHLGHSSQTYMENAVELVRIVRHFVAEKSSDMEVFSETVRLAITKTCLCNILQFFTALRNIIFR